MAYTGTAPELTELAEKEARKNIGVPVVRTDEEMCREAARLGGRVGAPAQGSMAYVARDIEKAAGRPALSSPRFGAMELKKALHAKGLI